MILAAILAACQDLFRHNPDQIRIFKRISPQDLPRNPGKCTIVRISRPEGTEIMSGQNYFANKTGTLPGPNHVGRAAQELVTVCLLQSLIKLADDGSTQP